MSTGEVFISRKCCKTCENRVKSPKCISIFESCPMGQNVVYFWPILAPEPYVWHTCYSVFIEDAHCIKQDEIPSESV